MCDSPSLFILSVLCVVVSIFGRLFFCIFSCDPLLFLSGVLCPSPQAIGTLLFLYAVWWDGQNTTGLLCSDSHRLEYCLLCCVFSWCCYVMLYVVCYALMSGRYQATGDVYPRVVYILRKRAYVGRVRMCSIFMIRVKFECSERLLLLSIIWDFKILLV